MNPLTNIRSRQRQREQEVIQGLSESASYHNDFKSSAYVYAGQLSFKLTEGDLLAIFSEYGEVVDVNLVRDKESRESRGFAFLAYEDQRSTDLAVDNLNGISIDGRVIAVDHVKDYKRLVDNPDAVHQAGGAAGAGAQDAAPDRGPGGGAPQQRANEAAPARQSEAPGGAPGSGAAPRGPSSLFDMLGEMEETIKAHKAGRPPEDSARPEHDLEDPMAAPEARRPERRSPSRHKEKSRHKHKHRREDSERKNSSKRRDRERELGRGRDEGSTQGGAQRRRRSPSVERRGRL